MVMLLESVVCWFPGPSEALIKEIRGITGIVLIVRRQSKLRFAKQQFLKYKAL